MKELFAQVYEDFRAGKLSWSTISLSHIQFLGGAIVEKVMNSAEDYYKSIKSTIFKEVSNDLSSISE
jgi:hypothetical protein